MRQPELGPRIPLEQQEQLWTELIAASNELGAFPVFQPNATEKIISREARKAAFEFAAAFGRCLLANLDVDTEKYFPAEISPIRGADDKLS